MHIDDLEMASEIETRHRSDLDETRQKAHGRESKASNRASAIVTRFKTEWPLIANDWLGGIDGLDDYLDHLVHLETEGLPDLVDRFRERLNRNATQSLARISQAIDAEREWPNPHQVIWTSRQFRQLGTCDVPERLEIGSIQALIEVLGSLAIERSAGWAARMEPLLALNKGFYPTLIKQILELEKLSVVETQLLAHVLPQLRRGMGEGRYFRALPLQGVDTKFLELNQSLITALLDGLHEQQCVFTLSVR